MRRVLLPLITLAALAISTPPVVAEPTEAQPKLPTIALVIGSKKLTAEVAGTEASRSAGLMFRESLGENEGMLFVMDEPGPAGFWMRNTTIPLSIAFMNSVGVIMDIYDLQPRDETLVSSQFTTIAYALEMPQGWFLKNGILPGDSVSGLPATADE